MHRLLLLAVQLLALGCSLGRAARVPRRDLDDVCLQQSLYADRTVQGSVVITSKNEFEFQGPVQTEDAVAWGSFLDSAYTVSNFGQLRITTSGDFSDPIQTFAAGWLEGYLTAPRIAQNYKNLHTYFNTTMGASLEEPMKWMDRQDAWVRQRCEEDRGFDMSRGAAPRAEEEEEDTLALRNGGEQAQGVDGTDSTTTATATNSEKSEFASRRLTGRISQYAPKDTANDDDVSKGRFWDATCLAIRQFDGVVAGYQARAASAAADPSKNGNPEEIPEMPYSHFFFLESNADLYDVIDKMQPSQRPSWSPGGDAPADPETAGKKLFHELALSGKCSALVKLAADLSDIYMGHSTWDSYTAMLRIYKHYNFDLRELQPAAQHLAFSSYPGQIFSDDDFFILSSKMVLLQTTNKIFNDDLFQNLTPESVLSWQRVRAANWLASSGEEWTQYLEMENSGTYNNQYMVVDLKQFVPGEDPRPGLLWVAEQIPGQVVRADMTSTLALGYWPSFNVPAFPEIYEASGYPDFISKLEKYGQHFTKSTHWLSYQVSPRASIFRRDHTSVTSLDTMKALMRSNNWKNDPLSEGHPICAVCGRGDLDTGFPEARGCYDSKVTSYSLAMNMEAEVISGPTTGTGSHAVGVNPIAKLPQFDWVATQKAVGMELVHEGQPRKFNFRFERMVPNAVMGGAAAGCGGRSGNDDGFGTAALASNK